MKAGLTDEVWTREKLLRLQLREVAIETSKPRRYARYAGACSFHGAAMREFFRGWRRKVGCVALVMACVVTGIWIRNLFIYEVCAVIVWGRLFWFGSGDNEVTIATWNAYPQFSYAHRFEAIGKSAHLRDLSERVRADENLMSLHIGFQWIVLPLILLAAILILWPRRNPK